MTLPDARENRVRLPEMPLKTDQQRAHYGRATSDNVLAGPTRFKRRGFCGCPAGG